MNMNAALMERSVSAPSTPTEQTKNHSHNSIKTKKKKRPRVHFPSDDLLVTCYLDPPDPWSKGYSLSPDTVLTAYFTACDKQGIEPFVCVLEQLQEIQSQIEKLQSGNRVFDLSLVGEKLSIKHCEALEEILRRIKFQTIDLEGCCLEDEGAAALFDMIEYYDSAVQLNISFIKFIDGRGWQACSKMLKKTNALLHLNARSTGLNEQVLLILGKALRLGSNLVTLHLENCGIFGRCLVILVAALKSNTTLRELFLAENKISSSDGFQLGNLLRTNTHLELLDLSNNKLQDEGLFHIMENLGQQSNTSGRGLSTLILWNNELTCKGMPCVAKALNSARTIKRFNLGSNTITSQGIQQLKQSFICNQTLEVLELENCKVTANGAYALAEYIASNTIIQKIDLRGNDIALEGVKALSDALMNNHNIISLQIDHTSVDLSECKERISEIQLMSQCCTRNKEKMRSLPPLDMHLCTLFNGIFSRVLPSSSPVDSQPNSPSTLGTSEAAKTNQKSRFQVSPVCLTEEEAAQVERSIYDISPVPNLTNGTADGMSNTAQSSHFPVDGITPNSIANTMFNKAKWLEGDGCNLETGKSLTSSLISDTKNDLLELAEQNDAQTTPPESQNDTNDVCKNNVIPQRNVPVSPLYSTFTSQFNGLSPTKVRSKEMAKRKGLSLTLASSSSFDLPSAVEPKERRLSSPNVPTDSSQIFRRVHSIKCCKELEGLDLCSSMPLSPTKLYENFSFPQPTMEEVPLTPQLSSKSSHTTYMVH